jgi:hypothetical protein
VKEALRLMEAILIFTTEAESRGTETGGFNHSSDTDEGIQNEKGRNAGTRLCGGF